jgi:peptidoglycan/LPS O-acetylase OafA/YrhL
MNAKPLKKNGLELSFISKYRNELYGIAILLIMLFHFTDVYVQHFGSFGSDSVKVVLISLYDRYVSSIGVELFVFLSGMSMYYSYTREPETHSFYAKRYKRILIPYFYAGGLFWIIKDIIILAEGMGRAVKDFLFISF